MYVFLEGSLGVKGQPTYYGSLTAYLLLALMSSHNTLLVYISGKVLHEVKVHLYEQCVLAVLSAHIPIHGIYLGRFYVRSVVIHESPPGYCVGKSVLHGKILHKNFDLT